MEKVKIGGIDYKITEHVNLCDEVGSKRLNGHILFDACEVRLDASIEPQMKNVVLWHEILHGLLTHAGVENQSETFLDVLSYGIDQVLRDNPALSEYYKGRQ